MPFQIDESIEGWTLEAYYGLDRAGVPLVTKTTAGTAGTTLITIGAGTAGTGSWVFTAEDSGRTLGPGIWPVELWRVDNNLQARLAWGEQIVYPVVASLPS